MKTKELIYMHRYTTQLHRRTICCIHYKILGCILYILYSFCSLYATNYKLFLSALIVAENDSYICSCVHPTVLFVCLYEINHLRYTRNRLLFTFKFTVTSSIEFSHQILKEVICIFYAILVRTKKFETRLQLNSNFENY